ncbi:hypothetical protein FRC12_010936 [Ceratobasidium sp. 428]|nr:hypothetical protein FRC12_010936 [Ceratobasidium sp. 428]
MILRGNTIFWNFVRHGLSYEDVLPGSSILRTTKNEVRDSFRRVPAALTNRRVHCVNRVEVSLELDVPRDKTEEERGVGSRESVDGGEEETRLDEGEAVSELDALSGAFPVAQCEFSVGLFKYSLRCVSGYDGSVIDEEFWDKVGWPLWLRNPLQDCLRRPGAPDTTRCLQRRTNGL